MSQILAPFINIILEIIFFIDLALIIWVIIGLLIHFDIVNRYSPIVTQVYGTLGRLIEPMLRPIRRFCRNHLPDMGGVDLSPLILLLILHFIRSALYNWFLMPTLLPAAI